MIYLEILVAGNLPSTLWYHYEHPNIIINQIVLVPLRKKTIWGLVLQKSNQKPTFITKPIQSVFEHSLPSSWLHLLQWLSKYYYSSMSLTLLSSISKTGIDTLRSFEKIKPLAQSTQKVQIPPPLSQEQEIKIKECSINLNTSDVFLLKGVTGSGKTRFYLEIILKTLKTSTSVLFFLPEIAIVKQTMLYISKFVSCPTVCIHSSESTAKVKQAWKAIFEQKQVVLFGVRSMSLVPINNVGLIIVDEEHDTSYKQSNKSPRYNAKNVALYRAKQWKCPTILGSATPSLESYFLTVNQKYKLIELHQRFNQQPLPEVKIIDMKEQLNLQGNEAISIPLRDALQETLDKKDQAILLINRRGYAKRRICKKCEKAEECPNCLCSLVPHKINQKLICHHCLYQRNWEFQCLVCKHNECLEVGLAIEKIEEKLQSYFPEKTITRLDRDSASTSKDLDVILENMINQNIDILLGTQMVAKSHDFPNVSLVGIIDADGGLGFPDFRRYETAFQLLTQVAGRAGRHRKKGCVYIQTFQPNQSIFNLVQNQNFSLFYKEEIQKRKSLFYPPYSRLFKIEFSGLKEETVWKSINEFYITLKQNTDKVSIQLLGPGFASLKKLQRKYRCQIFGKSVQTNQTQWAINQALQYYKKPSNIEINIDMDSISMM